MLSDEMYKLISIAEKILGDAWIIQYVNVELGTYELRAYTCETMCVITVEHDEFDKPLVLYYDYRKEK